MNMKEPSTKYWNSWYFFVLFFLVLQIMVFYWLTRYFN
jgi:hypothetical protein